MSGAAAARHGAAVRRRLYRHLERSTLLRDAPHLLVAVSGGVDSVALLHALRFGGTTHRLTAAHFDHAMREGSANDAAWLRGLCTAWSIPLVCERARVPATSEAGARAQRYAFLEEAAGRLGADAIVTAHHADDQAETVLFRILRGSGWRGLAGIPARRGRIVRPMLRFTRADVRAYARASGLTWREDPSNAEHRFARNRIRHALLPALEAARPGAARDAVRLAALAARLETAWSKALSEVAADVVQGRTRDGFALARERLLAYHPHVRARVLRQLSEQLGCRLDRAATRTAVDFLSAGGSGGRIDLPGGVRLEREFGTVLLRSARAADGDDVPLRIPSAEAARGTLVTGGQRFAARWGPAPLDAGAARTASFDPSSLRFPLELRGWRPGDRIQLAYGSKKVKKLFRERRVGRSLRTRIPVLVDAGGRVLWVPGHATARAVEGSAGTGFQIMVDDGISL
ncbi:MAG TPA: tRNA lysidine(34) synthetase TilS [Longimicrobiales bacterium]|nr:tRNA lysidine(34) synthetase TilS [Longimicrobiales bacterium]